MSKLTPMWKGHLKNGQTVLMCARGLVATMEAGSQAARDADATAIVLAVNRPGALVDECAGMAMQRDMAVKELETLYPVLETYKNRVALLTQLLGEVDWFLACWLMGEGIEDMVGPDNAVQQVHSRVHAVLGDAGAGKYAPVWKQAPVPHCTVCGEDTTYDRKSSMFNSVHRYGSVDHPFTSSDPSQKPEA